MIVAKVLALGLALNLHAALADCSSYGGPLVYVWPDGSNTIRSGVLTRYCGPSQPWIDPTCPADDGYARGTLSGNDFQVRVSDIITVTFAPTCGFVIAFYADPIFTGNFE